MILFHLFNFVLSLFNTVFKGFLIKTFWAWFVLTQFPALPKIGILPAIGFSMLISAISPWKSASAKELDEVGEMSADERLALSFMNGLLYFLAILISLGAGWVVHMMLQTWG